MEINEYYSFLYKAKVRQYYLVFIEVKYGFNKMRIHHFWFSFQKTLLNVKGSEV